MGVEVAMPSEDYLRMRLDLKTQQRLDALVRRGETTRSAIVRRAIRELATRQKVSQAELELPETDASNAPNASNL